MIFPFQGGEIDSEYFDEVAGILEFCQGMSKEDAEKSAAIATRPPTHDEAVDWIKKNARHPEYCRICFKAWAKTISLEFVKKVFAVAPDEVKAYCIARKKAGL